jgi:hypothetical protein
VVGAAAATPAAPNTSRAANVAMGHFSWGMDPATRKPWTPASIQKALATDPALARDLKATLKRATTTIATPLPTISKMDSEGLLASDPRKIKSGAVTRRFDDVYAWAVAARLGPPALQAKATQATIDTLMSYAQKYKPTGNPINEHNFLPFFKAADLAMPLMSAHQQKVVRAWMQSFVHAAEHFPLPGMEAINNWKTFSLQIRGTAATALGDRAELAKTSKELESLLKKTIRADGSSLDFHHRDAFHYHLYNSEALLDLAISAPGAVSETSKKLIEKTFTFIKPYYLGQKKHMEFQHTQVAFDRQRAAAGEKKYQPHPWDPREADKQLQRARAIFPSLRPWSAKSEAAGAGLRGEFEASLKWPQRPV